MANGITKYQSNFASNKTSAFRHKENADHLVSKTEKSAFFLPKCLNLAKQILHLTKKAISFIIAIITQ